MSQVPQNPWIHIGECPVCVDGLCRVRTSMAPDGRMHHFAMCDECEAIFLKPKIDETRQFPDAENPVCPLTGVPLFGEHSHWATPQDVKRTVWEKEAIFDMPSDQVSSEQQLPKETDPQ